MCMHAYIYIYIYICIADYDAKATYSQYHFLSGYSRSASVNSIPGWRCEVPVKDVSLRIPSLDRWCVVYIPLDHYEEAVLIRTG